MDSFKRNGPFIINLKNYLETAGDNTMRIVKDAERVSEKVDVEIIISPPQPSLALITKQTNLKVISQHIDMKKSWIYNRILCSRNNRKGRGNRIINQSQRA